MKKKKLVLILFSIFLLSGCCPKFTYEIDGNKITESAEITLDDKYTDDEINTQANYFGFGSKDEYSVSITRNDGYVNVFSKGNKKNIESFFNDDLAYFNRCFDNIYFVSDDDEKKNYLSASSFKCLYYEYMVDFNEVDISIKTYNKVYENNADSVKNGVYTWHIDDTNYNDKKITIVVSSNKYVWYYKFRNLFVGLAIVAGVLVFIWLFVSMFKFFSKKANKI